MQIIIFGTGAYYKRYKSFVSKKDSVVALADNNIAKQGTVIDGVPVFAPEKLHDIKFDTIVVLLAYPAAVQVREQLFQLGIPTDKILFYDEYIAKVYRGQKNIYEPKPVLRLAIVSREFDYSGSSSAIFAAAISLYSIGYDISFIVPACDRKFVQEVNRKRICVIEYPSILCMNDSDLTIFDDFDFVIVNVVPMIDSAIKILGNKPMLWWIHEPGDSFANIYKNMLARYPNYLKCPKIYKIPVFAVSHIAERAFKNYFPDVPVKILPYCVKDEGEKFYIDANLVAAKKKIIIFAIIARFSELKNQKLFLEVAKMLNQKHFERLRFLLVGKAEDNTYSHEVINLASQMQNVELTGVLTRSQLADLYKNGIDVVVCPSLEETMSLAITEGMMHGKVCIVSENTGMAEYITDGKNGFICKAGDRSTLYEKMLYVAEHFDTLDDMRRAARKTYEENFTMDIFVKRLDGIIKDIMRDRNITENRLNAKI